MYRKRNGSIGFSLSKLAAQITSPHASQGVIDAVVTPTATNGIASNTDSSARVQTADARTRRAPVSGLYFPSAIPLLQLDILHSHQLASPAGFGPLDPLAFQVTSIVPTPRLSKAVHRALIKHAILDAQGNVCTTNIQGAKFAHQMALLSSQKRQKDVIELLFYWEEEVQRFKKLMGEIEDLNGLIENVQREIRCLSRPNGSGSREREQRAGSDSSGGGDDDDGDDNDSNSAEPRRMLRERLDQVKFARERVRMKIRMRPSQRTPEIEGDRDDLVERFASGRLANMDDNPTNAWFEGLMNSRVTTSSHDRLPFATDTMRLEQSRPREQLPEYHVVAAR